MGSPQGSNPPSFFSGSQGHPLTPGSGFQMNYKFKFRSPRGGPSLPFSGGVSDASHSTKSESELGVPSWRCPTLSLAHPSFTHFSHFGAPGPPLFSPAVRSFSMTRRAASTASPQSVPSLQPPATSPATSTGIFLQEAVPLTARAPYDHSCPLSPFLS